MACVVALSALLAGCGGGDSDPVVVPPPPAAPVSVLQPVGAAADITTVVATACAAPLDAPIIGRADVARYPKANGVFRGWPSPGTPPVDYATPLQLRADRSGGFVVSHWTDAKGAMFKIAANGDKSVLPMAYASSFDVAADGTIWFVANGALSTTAPDGKVTQLAALGSSATAVDGPLGAATLGPVTLIAAGKDKVYLLVEEATPNTTGINAPAAFNRSLKVLSRAAQTQSGWVVNTVLLWGGLSTIDVVSAMRVDSSDRLVVLVNEPFKRIASQQGQPPHVSYRFNAEAWVRVLDAAGNWVDMASKGFDLTSGAPSASVPSYEYTYTLDAKDLAVAPNGDVWVGGAGAIFKVSRESGWQRAGRLASTPSDQIGLDGALASATFASANQLAADNAGVVLYDGETCQIRRLTETQINTLSGPRLSGVSVAGANFLGQDIGGDLLLGRGALAINPYRGSYTSQAALLRAAIALPTFKPELIKSLAVPLGPDAQCVWAFSNRGSFPAVCSGATTDPSRTQGIWLGSGTTGVLARVGNDFLTGLERGSGTVISSTNVWPGILIGDAPSGFSGVHVDGGKYYIFGWMRIDPPTAFNTYQELRLYQMDTQTGAVSVVAGASFASETYGGRKVDLSPVIPNAGAGPAFVQHRSDGKFWLSNGKELWLLETAGQLKRVAGLSISGGGVDGVGDGASFARISSIRVLPDNRLLVVDQGAHAIRLLGDDGKVTTLVGKLNTQGASVGTLPTTLDTPVDAFAVGKDVYITTQTSRNLLLANGVL